MTHVAELFAHGQQRRADLVTDENELLEQIGYLKIDGVWSTKELPGPAEVKRLCIVLTAVENGRSQPDQARLLRLIVRTARQTHAEVQ